MAPLLSCSSVLNVGSGKCFALFPFQTAPSEKDPIKTSFHLSKSLHEAK